MTQTAGNDRLFDALDATWAPAEVVTSGPWTLRRGAGGGKRVSAATAKVPVSEDELTMAENLMISMDQPPLFMIRGKADTLDGQLADRGYSIVDPTLLLTAPCAELAKVNPPPIAAIPGDEPLAIMAEIWAAGGIGPARLAVMRRTRGPKTYLFSRFDTDKPGGCAFVAVDGDIAMLHALEVVPMARRKGVGHNLLGRAAIWAMEQGATTFGVVTTGKNLPAQKLFTGLGMTIVDKYHYRMK